MERYQTLIGCLVLGVPLVVAMTGPRGWSQLSERSWDRDPLYISHDHGDTWQSIRSGLVSEIEVSFVEPLGPRLYVATDNAGIFYRPSPEEAWVSIGDKLPAKKINALRVEPDAIFAAPYRRGVFESVDNGDTWRSLNFDLPDLAVQAFAQSDGLLAGTDTGVFRLASSAHSWQPLLTDVQVVSLDASNGVIVAGTSEGTAISLDGGRRWRWSRDRNAVHYSRVIDGTIFELKLNGDVLFSDDQGTTWTPAVYAPRQGSYAYDIVQVGSSLLMSNNYGIHRSDDGGRTWSHRFKSESMAFFDLLADGDTILGGTRGWDEYRKRSRP